MKGKPLPTLTFALISALALLVLLAAGCEQTAEEPVVVAAVEVEVPGPVAAAQESVLQFLRTSANHCVPPEGVQWRVSDRQGETPAGYGAYRFSAEGCTITVSYPLAAGTTTYHVALSNDVTGFCWQALVNEQGKIMRTGVAADSEHDGNPAATYCRDQGYTYEIRTLESGQKCGACVFSDGSTCKAWDFFHGDCSPGDNPSDSNG